MVKKHSENILRFSLALACLAVTIGFSQPALGETLHTTAMVRLIDESDAPAQSAGVVVEVLAREGDRVVKGDLLAKLDDSEARLQVKAAQLDVQIAQQLANNDVALRYATKVAEVAEAELRRSQESIRQFAKSVSESQIDVEKLNAEKARLERERAEEEHQAALMQLSLRKTELEAAKLILRHRQVLAPMSGVLVEVRVHCGEWLEPGQKAFRLVRTDRLRAEAFVEAAKANASLVGAKVRVEGRLGKVTFVSPEIDPINRQVRMIAEFENEDLKLRPGDRVKMAVEYQTAESNNVDTNDVDSVGARP